MKEKAMRRLAALTCSFVLAACCALAAADDPGPRIELAILLDTSGSMSGLINQARTRIWSIVNDLARTRKDGQVPDLRVSLYQYGNDGLESENGWVQRILPLTDDLDEISEKLFALSTNGGTECCGTVIDKAVKELHWSEGDHYRAIFIAGNEPFTQGSVDYKVACKAAVTAGIVVNTIHCGSPEAGRTGMWVDGARLGDGEALNIDQNQAQVAIETEYDDEISELNGKLNETYVHYGAAGKLRAERQVAQDANAAAAGAPTAAQRAAAKASVNYKNASWDLVDAVAEDEVELAELDDEDLPEELQGKSVEEIEEFVAGKAEERAGIQKQLKELVAKRDAVVAEKRKELADGADADDSFGAAVQAAMAEQLEARGYEQAEE